MSKGRSFLIPFLAVLLAGLVAFFFLSGHREKIRKAEPEAGPEAAAADAGETVVETRPVILFFPRDDDDRLVPVEREIPAFPAAPAAEARAILAELIKGPSDGLVAALPPETRIGQVFITRDGTAYLDLSRDIVDRHPSGSSAEIATLYAIVDSLTYNIRTVRKVFLLVEGEERETLAGHLTLDRPFPPDYSWIARDVLPLPGLR